MPVPVSVTATSTQSASGAEGPPRRRASSAFDVARGEREPTAARHGVARVHREVEQHLLQLARVDLDGPEVGRGLRGEGDVVAEHAAQQLLDVEDEDVQVDDLGGRDLAAREREQLVRERGGAIGRIADALARAASGRSSASASRASARSPRRP